MSQHRADVPKASPPTHRRDLLIGVTASLLCAPAIVRASSLMPVKVVEWTPLALPVSEKPYAGWVERVGQVEKEHGQFGFDGRFGPGLPRIDNGSLMFLLTMLSKRKPSPDEGGEGSREQYGHQNGREPVTIAWN